MPNGIIFPIYLIHLWIFFSGATAGIRQALIAKGMCPKCSSRKCIVGDLLPNLSLRRAIEHFLESQMFDAGFEDVMQKYAPGL